MTTVHATVHTTVHTAVRPAALGVSHAAVLDVLYLLAVIVAVAVGGIPRLALAVPVAAVLGLRAVRRRTARTPG